MSTPRKQVRSKIVGARLFALVDTDPHLAIAEARKPDIWETLADFDINSVKAAVLIDAGSKVHDRAAIIEGCEILRGLLAKLPDDQGLLYNLGNGLSAEADSRKEPIPEWFLATADTRREARLMFLRAAADETSRETQTRALTNLGNALNRANRWVEAYDAYLKALAIDRTNVVASFGAAKTLLRSVNRGIGRKHDLLAAAARHLKNAKANESRLRELAGEHAYASFKGLLDLNIDVRERRRTDTSGYERFVAENRLALALTIEGADTSQRRWDTLAIHSLQEPIDTGSGLPPLFAMFNVLKGEYLLARRMVYDAYNEKVSDTGSYADSLDYALYGVQPAMVTSAQSMCLDILDKIAVAVTEFMELKDDSRKIWFRNRWFASAHQKKLAWHPSMLECLARGNTAVIALAEMSLDLADNGFLSDKKSFRDAGTHRYIVLHDIGMEPSRTSRFVDHASWTAFHQITVDSLRLARAAMIYFVEFIALEERQKGDSADPLTLEVPDHHFIRGHDR